MTRWKSQRGRNTLQTHFPVFVTYKSEDLSYNCSIRSGSVEVFKL